MSEEITMNDEVANQVEKAEDEAVTVGTVIIGLVIATIAGALCYYTWMETDLLDSVFEADASGRGARKVKFFLGLLYNRITGSLAGVISLAIIWGTLTSIPELFKNK